MALSLRPFSVEVSGLFYELATYLRSFWRSIDSEGLQQNASIWRSLEALRNLDFMKTPGTVFRAIFETLCTLGDNSLKKVTKLVWSCVGEAMEFHLIRLSNFDFLIFSGFFFEISITHLSPDYYRWTFDLRFFQFWFRFQRSLNVADSDK